MPFTSGLMPISIRDILYVVFRHKWKVTGFFVFVVLAVTAATYILPEKYRSDARLLIRVGRESLSVDPSVSGPTMPVHQDRESEVNSELSILRSRYLMERVIQTMGDDAFVGGDSKESEPGLVGMAKGVVKGAVELAKGVMVALDLSTALEPHEKAIKTFMKSLSVQVETRTSIISVGYEAKNPELARQALDNLLRFFLERHIEVHAAQASPDFFKAQEERLRGELALREQALNDYRLQNGIATLEGQKSALLEQINNLERDFDDAAVQARSSEARVAALEESLKGRASTIELNRTTGRTNYAADSLKERLMELRLQETDLSARYPDTYRPLIEKREQIKETEAALAAEDETLTEVTTGLDTNYQRLQLDLQTERAQLGAQQARRDVLEKALADSKAKLAELAGREVELKRLQRDVEMAEAEYRTCRDNLQRASVSSALDIDKVSNVAIVQPATLPLGPSRPNKPLNMALGLLLGLFGGIFLAFVFEYLDDSLNTREDVEKWLGVPVLAVISEEEFKACT